MAMRPLGIGEYSSAEDIQRAARELFLETLVRLYPSVLGEVLDVARQGENRWFLDEWRLDVPWFREVLETTVQQCPHEASGEYAAPNHFVMPPHAGTTQAAAEPIAIPAWIPTSETEREYRERVGRVVGYYVAATRLAADYGGLVPTPRRESSHFEWLVRIHLEDDEPTYADLARELGITDPDQVREKAADIGKAIRELAGLIDLPVRTPKKGRPRADRYDPEWLVERLQASIKALS